MGKRKEKRITKDGKMSGYIAKRKLALKEMNWCNCFLLEPNSKNKIKTDLIMLHIFCLSLSRLHGTYIRW